MEYHPNLDPAIVDRINKSEQDGGVLLSDLPEGTIIKVQTVNTLYVIKKRKDDYVISGSQKYCPLPIPCQISGSTWGGSMLKIDYIGVGMHMEFYIESKRIVSSVVQSINLFFEE